MSVRDIIQAAAGVGGEDSYYLYTWGRNLWGELGNGTAPNTVFFQQIGTATDWPTDKEKLTGCGDGGGNHAIKTNGTLWAWGNNENGRLGDGTTTNRSSPVQIGALSDWAKIKGGNRHVLAIKTNGTLWAWGSNTSGQLGDGTTTDRSSPVQIGALSDWSQVNGGNSFSIAIKTNGTLWSWGTGYAAKP